MANRKKRVIIESDKGALVYENKSKDTMIFNDNGKLYFESTNEILGDGFYTYDCAEAVAVLMKSKTLFNDDKIWNLKVGDNKYDVSPERALYWLSGGDREWKDNDTYAYEWSEVNSIFEYKFREIVYQIVENAETLRDIKEGFIKRLNLPILYEFALSNDLI